MTVQRWVTTTLVMAAVGLGLWAMAPDPGAVLAAVTDPQHLVDTRGPDALLVPLTWALAAACWSWGAVGLLLTAASTAPGPGGRVAHALLVVLLPAGLRRAAALAVGVSLVAAPVVVLGSPAAVPTVVSTAAQDTAAQDTPAQETAAPAWSDVGGEPAAVAPVPDWPAPPTTDQHVVLRGDCLWDIAAAWLGPASDTEVQGAVRAWWQANAAVIGPDPDLLLPGQVLHAPPAP